MQGMAGCSCYGLVLSADQGQRTLGGAASARYGKAGRKQLSPGSSARRRLAAADPAWYR